jgi:hypothetical protein
LELVLAFAPTGGADYAPASDNSNDSDETPFVPRFKSNFFHVDSYGKTCFSSTEAKLATERVKEIQLLKKIETSINTLDLHLPQSKSSVNSFFCNESVYGEMVIEKNTRITCSTYMHTPYFVYNMHRLDI